MSFGFGFGLPSWQTLSGGFNPSSLFVGGTQGVWYDPSDSSTLFSDTAGTTPSPTPGGGALSVVGLMLDKSQNGVGTNGAYRYNLLTFTEQFDNAAWTLVGGAITANTTIAPNGTTTADTFTASATTARHSILPTTNPAITSGATYTITCYIKKGNYNFITLIFGAAGTTWITATFDFTSGTPVVSKTGAGAVGSVNTSSSASLDQNGFYRLSLTGALTGFAAAFVSVALSSSATPTYGTFGEESWTAAGTETVILWGAQLALATAPTAYQRITADWYSTMAGNHAISYNTTTARPELSARVNLLTYSEQFDNAAWTKTRATVSANIIATTDPLGGNTADKIVEGVFTGNDCFVEYLTFTHTASVSYTFSVYAKAAERTRVIITWPIVATNNPGIIVDLLTGTATSTSGSPTVSITNAGNGWWRIALTMSANPIFSNAIKIGPTANTTSFGTTIGYNGDGTSGIYIWGADLRPANIGTSVPSYQRIADQYTYDSSGFPRYLVFNGTASGMYTPANLNLSGTDKATVFAGVRKISDANTGMLIEYASTNGWTLDNGSFAIYAPSYISGTLPAPKYFQALRGSGTSRQEEYSTFTAPISNVIADSLNIGAAAASELVMRINGTAVSPSAATGDAGTGNFGNYLISIGQRPTGGTFLNGYLYSLIVVGAASTAAQISSTESWINVKEGTVY